MLSYFDLMPMIALRTIAATAALALLLCLAEGVRALRLEIDAGRFLLLGLMIASFFAFYALGLRYSNPITAAAVQVAGPLVSAATVRRGHRAALRSRLRRGAGADLGGRADPRGQHLVRCRPPDLRRRRDPGAVHERPVDPLQHQDAGVVRRSRQPAAPRLRRDAVGDGVADPVQRRRDRRPRAPARRSPSTTAGCGPS